MIADFTGRLHWGAKVWLNGYLVQIMTVVCEQNVSNGAKMDGKSPQNDETIMERVRKMEEILESKMCEI